MYDCFPSAEPFPIPSFFFFLRQNIFYYAAIKEAFIRKKQENRNRSMIQDNAKHANCTLELTCDLSEKTRNPRSRKSDSLSVSCFQVFTR